MPMIQNACSDPGLQAILGIARRIVTLIQVIAPILLIVMLAIHFIRLMKDPEEKKHIQKLRNSLIALLVVFIVPTSWSVLMGVLGEDTTISACWNNANPSYSNTYVGDDSQKTNMSSGEGDYEKGTKKQSKTNSSETGSGSVSGSDYRNKLASMATPSVSEIEAKAALLGFQSDYVKILIGTTAREGYVNDPYLYYGWASAMINQPKTVQQMQGWDPSHSGDANYYSWNNILKGYNSASSDVLKSVYLALTERNPKIVECNGMYTTTPSGYNKIYQSSVYNCAIYETK